MHTSITLHTYYSHGKYNIIIYINKKYTQVKLLRGEGGQNRKLKILIDYVRYVMNETLKMSTI